MRVYQRVGGLLATQCGAVYLYSIVGVTMTPDDFPPVMDADLRTLCREHRNTDVRRLILEVYRAREVQGICLGSCQKAVYEMWETHSPIAQEHIQKAIDCLTNEKVRLGCRGGIPVPRPIKR
jgi:hypothetical protein